MNPLLLGFSDCYGGAARAMLRLHQALSCGNVNSRILVGLKKTDHPLIEGESGKFAECVNLLRRAISIKIASLQRTTNRNLHSLALIPSGHVGKINRSIADVVNLHWICGEFLSITDIGHIHKPIVWTLHDMWPFCGAEHIVMDEVSPRWRQGYKKHNRPFGHRGIDIDRWTWNRKRRAWRQPMHIVVPSRWLANCVCNSSMMAGWPVEVIPNVLDTHKYKPLPKRLARDVLGLPQSKPLILFGAIGGTRDLNKGWGLLQQSFGKIKSKQSDIEVIIFGQSQPSNRLQLYNMPLHWLGYLHDDATLALVYSAADVMIVPSLQEAFGQTASEAQSCGCPVVAFDCTGLPDVIEHGITGYLAQPYEPDDLAKGVCWVLEDLERHAQLSTTARKRAVSLWSPEIVVPQYLRVYQAAIDGWPAMIKN